jgi:hypothetical protein
MFNDMVLDAFEHEQRGWAQRLARGWMDIVERAAREEEEY